MLKVQPGSEWQYSFQKCANDRSRITPTAEAVKILQVERARHKLEISQVGKGARQASGKKEASVSLPPPPLLLHRRLH